MPQEQHRATARVLDILEHLAVKKEGLTLTELAQELEAPKSSLFPIVHTLEERRYLRQNRETGRYTVGSGIWILGAAFAADGGLEPIVEVMKKVVAECQETCQLGLLEKGNVLYVEKEDSPQAIRMISWVGNRLPANATAIGKALLSGLTDAEIRRLYADGLPQLSGKAHPLKDVVAQNEAYGLVPDELLSDQKRLSEPVGRRLLGIGETDPVVGPVSEQPPERGQVPRRGDH